MKQWFLVLVKLWKLWKWTLYKWCNIKVGLSPSEKTCLICFNESPLKIMENTFYFILKALFVFKIFKFLPWRFGHVEKSFIRKIRLISTFMASQPGQQTITIHILPNISRSKGNQTMIFGQVMQYNMINIFLQKSCRRWARESSSRPPFAFQKSFIWGKSKWSTA